MRKTAGVDFHIYNPARLMELVGAELAVSVPESSLDDARKTAEELQARSSAIHFTQTTKDIVIPVPPARFATSRASLFDLVRTAERAVGRWLASRHPGAAVERVERGPIDWLVNHGTRRIGVEVRVMRDERLARMMHHKLLDLGYRAFYEISAGNIDSYLAVLVAPNIEVAAVLVERTEELVKPEPYPTISVGFLDDGGEYVELAGDPS
jgi:hypothetical protein